MTYVVLARKYRPQNFDELIGQAHITGLLKKSIETERLAHAYLFCGPRGIGKTSCARILAKSLNCQKGLTLKPCGTCTACEEIARANSFDVIEIDGASNRGIDEIRTLRENVKFAPSYGRYKIYIIDEVHMLTTEAFNALLKTLEEPPAHAKFIFATTAPSKVPSTIISRCQRFDFKRISTTGITKTLSGICKSEKFKVDQEALFAIAKAASGSMRDALSILDQLGAINQRSIKAGDVFSMLGMVEVELLFKLADALIDNNCREALAIFDEIIDKGKDVKQLSKDLIEHFRHLMIIKIGGKSLGRMVDYPVAIKEMLLTQSQRLALENILFAIETFIRAQEMSQVVGSLRIPLEVAFAKLTYDPRADPDRGNSTNTGGLTDKTEGKNTAIKPEANWLSPSEVLASKKGHMNFSVGVDTDDSNVEKLDTAVDAVEQPAELTLDRINKLWDVITHTISRKKMSVATYLQEGAPYQVKENKLIISLPSDAAFHKETLEEKGSLKLIEEIFSEKLGMSIKIKFKTVDDHKPKDDGPFIKAALDAFKGKIVNKWHRDE